KRPYPPSDQAIQGEASPSEPSATHPIRRPRHAIRARPATISAAPIERVRNGRASSAPVAQADAREGSALRLCSSRQRTATVASAKGISAIVLTQKKLSSGDVAAIRPVASAPKRPT